MKLKLLTLALMLTASASYAVLEGFGTCPRGFGTTCGTPALLGIQKSEIWGGFFSVGNTATTTAATFKQLELGLIEYHDSLADFTINPTGDLVCNTSATEVTDAIVILTTSMLHVDTQTRNFQVAYGTCNGCIGDSFPQLDDSDSIPATTIPISFYNNQDTQPVPLTAVLASIPANGCLGLMVKGDVGRSVLVGLGTLTVVAGDSDGVSAQLLQNQVLAAVEISRLFGTVTFGGAGGSVEATNTEWRQVPLDMVLQESTGTGITISADNNLVCNTSGITVNGGFLAAANISQLGGAPKTLEFKLGVRAGEGALVDGDEIDLIQIQKGFTAGGMDTSQTVVPGHGQIINGACVGLMVRSTTGIPLQDYTVEAGTMAITFRRVIP